MDYTFHFEVLENYWTWLAKGLWITVYISIISMFFALIIGLIISICRLSKIKVLVIFSQSYIEIFRGIPLFVFIIWLYYGLAMVSGINFEPVTAGIICLSMQHGGYLAEIYRAGIQAVSRGQWEASFSLGFSIINTFARIIFPQAVKIIIPPTANMFIGLFKDSALVSIIGVNELMRQSQIATSLTFRPFEFYTVTAIIYIVLTLFLSQLAKLLELKMSNN
ncbi:MAG: amino acid ABC transporter permease [Candidatus Marinimicrobia bacterium]|jgi:His/Glu/Gln/Arg/opine family amino acid ABC transporter permease subunit|nr:amino acid ABC transporter permease [Candidatus Neomarinimicrobiota bacterium]